MLTASAAEQGYVKRRKKENPFLIGKGKEWANYKKSCEAPNNAMQQMVPRSNGTFAQQTHTT